MKTTHISLLALSIGLTAAPVDAAAGQKVVPATATTAPKLPAGVTAGPAMGGVSEYDLSNGLKVLLLPDQSKTTVAVNIAYKVGSLQETYGITGSAHLLEHMLFKGTPKVPNLVGALRDRGIGYNASTGKDRTNYVTSFLAKPETLDWVLEAEADRMVNAKIDKRDLDSEMTVVRNELEIGENRQTNLFLYRLQAVAYDWHNYGKSTIGARSDVENVPISRLREFYTRWYRPDNAVLIISGKFDPQRTLAKVAQAFGAIAKPAMPLPPLYTVEPVQDGERQVVIRRPGEQRMFGLAYHVPASTHPDNAALTILASAATRQPNGRLYKALVRSGLATGVNMQLDDSNDAGLAMIVASPQDGAKPEQMEAELVRQVETLAQTPFTDHEVDQVKRDLRNQIDAAADDVDGLAQQIVETVGSDWRMVFRQRADLMKVTAADVNRVAATYFKPTNRTAAIFIPTEKPALVKVEPAPSVASLVAGLKASDIASAGETLDGTLATIEARTKTVTIGDTLKLSMLSKKSRGDRVVGYLSFHFGDDVSMRGRMDAAAFAGRLLMYGTATMDRDQIKDRVAELGGGLTVSGQGQNLLVTINARKDHVVEQLRLAAKLMREATFPEAEFKEQKANAVAQLQGTVSDSSHLYRDAVAQHFDPWPAGHPKHASTSEEELAAAQAITLDEVRHFAKDFYGTAVGEAVFVGDFDPKVIEAEMRTLFAGWRSPHPYRRLIEQYRPIAATRKTFEIPGRPNADFLARTSFPIAADDRDQAALEIASYILGGGLASRMPARIRGKEGLSYSVRAQVRTPEEGNIGSLGVSVTTPPVNLAKVEASTRDVLSTFVRDGATREEVETARGSILDGIEASRSGDGNIATLLMNNLIANRTLEYQRNVERWIREVTVAEVNAAIKKHLNPDAISIFVAGDIAQAPRSVSASN